MRLTGVRLADTRTSFLAGGGEMGERIRQHDWSGTPLGPAEEWPQSLKTAVRIMLTSRQAMFVWWGDRLINLYNDAYKAIVGGKHPQALGQPAAQVWREIWDQVGPRAATAMESSEGTYDEALQLIMERNGYPEETYYTFSYSQIPSDQGGVGGIICANTDETRHVFGERQLALLRELAAQGGKAATGAEACDLSARCLARNAHDLPFALLYLVEPEHQRLVLAGSSGIPRDHAAVPLAPSLDDASVWPFPEVLGDHRPHLISVRELGLPPLPAGAWRRPPHQVVMVPIRTARGEGEAGILIAGLNPHRIFDEFYRGFIELVAGQIAGNLASAASYEQERARVRALAELDHAKTVFFSNVSHEFRTPLTLMLGPLDDLLDGSGASLAAEQRDTLGLMRRNGRRLLKMVNTLLDFSRIEAGRVQAVFQPLDLASFTAELASNFRSAVEKAGLRLIVNCPPLSSPAYVDRDMWEKIVLNLISNAFKFTLAGEIEVSLTARGQQALLQVRDTGIGIAESDQPRVFDRFHRVENAGGRTEEGTGIGLSLVQELARLHGGEARVESVLGQGSTFTVTVPFGREQRPPEPAGGARSLASTAIGASAFVEEALRWLPEADGAPDRSDDQSTDSPASAGGPGGRILVADDNADMRGYITQLLSSRFGVTAVSNGEAALQSAEAERPDLILSDVMMPRMDGFELVRAIRERPALADIPVILLSARAGAEASVEGMKIGADDYLYKPFGARELMARVTAHVELARNRRIASEREQMLRTEAETLNAVAQDLTAELDLEALLQRVTDAGRRLTGAKFGAFFYNSVNERGETYLLYTLSGASRSDFDKFGMPRNTEVFGATFRGEGVVRVADILADPRYGHNAPHRGMPEGHLPVRSYLAIPVISRTGVVIGGLFFGHPEPGVFTERAERLGLGIAAQAAVAFDNARLYTEARREIAERIRVEEVLRDSEQRYRQLVQALPAALYTIDADGVLTAFNQAAVELWGREPVIGKEKWCGSLRLTYPDGTPVPLEDCPTAVSLRQGLPVRGEELVIERPDGTRRHVLPYPEPLRDSSGAITGAMNMVVDITEQRQATRALRESEERFTRFMQRLPGLAWIKDDEGRYIFANESAQKAFGHSLEEIKGRTDQEIFPPETASLYRAADRMAIEKDSGIQLVETLKHPDGSIHASLVSKFPIPASEGHSRLIGGIAIDITERARAEMALRESEERLRLATQTGKVGVWDWDILADRLSWTDSLYQIHGVNEIEPTREGWSRLIHPEDREMVSARLTDAVENGAPYELEFRSVRPDGKVIWLYTSAIVLRELKQPVRMLGATLDITERKVAEGALIEADRRKDEFLATLAHELRNPLAPIRNGLQILRLAGDRPETAANAVGMMERQLQQMIRLIDDLLDLSRISRGTIELKLEQVDLAKVVLQAVETSRPLIEQSRHRLELNVPSGLLTVNADVTRLAQVFANLLNNAAKYTGPGGVIQLVLQRDGSEAVVRVRDNGVGIPPTMLVEVFEMFAQVDRSLERTHGGLGIGLSIARRLVEMHRGSIHATSAGSGKGSEFVVRLPTTEIPPAGAADPQDQSRKPVETAKRRILVADDNDLAASSLATLLELMGNEVRIARDGAEAVEVAQSFEPDVILMDIGMPKLNGYEACRAIRAQPWSSRAILVALTGWGQDEARRRSKEVGFTHHMVKPVSPDALEALLGPLRG